MPCILARCFKAFAVLPNISVNSSAGMPALWNPAKILISLSDQFFCFFKGDIIDQKIKFAATIVVQVLLDEFKRQK